MIHLSHPLVAALFAFLAGLLPALRFAPSPPPLLALGVLTSLAALLLRAPARPRARASELLLLLALASAGGALGAQAARDAADDCRVQLADASRVRVRGVLAAAHLPPGEDLPPLLPLAHATVADASGSLCSGALRVRLPAGTPATRTGASVEVAGSWVRLSDPVVRSDWPGDASFAGFVAADSLLLRSPPDLRRNPLLTLRGATDERLRRLFPGHDALAEALLLGRRERMDPEVRDRFARAGLVHLLAISGSHVGLLAAVALLLGAMARLPRERLAWFTLFSVAAYLAMIGAPASAVRAGIMLALGLVATVLQRPSAYLPIIAAAALALLAVEPLVVLDPGFQLSFAGVLGIVGARRALRAVPKARRGRRWAWRLAEALTMSAAAFLATAPIAAHHFGQVAPVAVLANLPAVPLMALALAGVVGAVLLSLLAFPVARLLADGAGVAFDALNQVAVFAADLPHGHLFVARPPWGVWMLGALALLLALDAAVRSRARVRWLVAAGSAASVALLASALAAIPHGELEVHFLDVGQGDAIAVRSPAGRWLLVDAGPRSRTFDAGERRVLPFLRAHGARRLEALVLTHPDLDHIGGAPTVLRGIPVARVVEPGLAVGKESYLEVLDEVEAHGVAWVEARAGRALELDGVRLEFLWPEGETLDGAAEANQISAVARLRFHDFAMLLTGDASEEVERRLVERYGDGLRAQVVKAGHHGSATSTSAELLRAARPELVVISAGRRNRYGHPAPEVLGRLRDAGIRIARTDLEGTVTLRAAAGPGGRWRREEP